MGIKEPKDWKKEEHSLAEILAEAEKGNRAAMRDAVFQIGRIGYADDEETRALLVKYLSILVDEGDSICMIMLAGHYEKGDGVPKDVNKAIALYKKAARDGHVFAYECIGLMYFRGKDVPKDYGKAWQYFKKVRKEDHYGSSPCTWYAIGEMYRNGWKVKLNIAKAEEYYDRVITCRYAKMDSYYYPTLFQKARLDIAKERKNRDIDKSIDDVERVHIEYLKNTDDTTLHECITEKEIIECITALKQAKEDEPRSIEIELDKPMIEAEFDKQIVKVLPTLRDLQYEFMVVALHYDHPYKVRFIQTCLEDEDGSYCIEVARYEIPPFKHPRYKNKLTFKLYRLEPMSEVGLRDVIEIFRQVIFATNEVDLSKWTDITKRLTGANYYSVAEK